MRFTISGADRDTGEDIDLVLDAVNEEEATNKASRRGVLVASCRPAEITSSLPTHRPQRSPLVTPKRAVVVPPLSNPTPVHSLPQKPTWRQVAADEALLGVPFESARFMAADALFCMGTVDRITKSAVNGSYVYGANPVTLTISLIPATETTCRVVFDGKGQDIWGAAATHACTAFFESLRHVFDNNMRKRGKCLETILLPEPAATAFERAVEALRRVGNVAAKEDNWKVAFGQITFIVYALRVKIVVEDGEATRGCQVSLQVSPKDTWRLATSSAGRRFAIQIRNPQARPDRFGVSKIALLSLSLVGILSAVSLLVGIFKVALWAGESKASTTSMLKIEAKKLPLISTESAIGGGSATSISLSNWHTAVGGYELRGTLVWNSGQIDNLFYTVKRNGSVARRGSVSIPGGALKRGEPVEISLPLPSDIYDGMEVIIEVVE